MSALPPNLQHAISAWFIGPKAENCYLVKNALESLFTHLEHSRVNLFVDDPCLITSDIMNSSNYQQSVETMREHLEEFFALIQRHSTPLYSPRYNQHMGGESSLPAILGYLSTFLCNPNNITVSAAPFTTQLEVEVAQQLCEMIGFDLQASWGHITSGGTSANIESIWVARNLKFLPISLQNAMFSDSLFNCLRNTFKITTCKGQEKLFMDLTTWELLNLRPSVILDISNRLQKFGISNDTFLNIISQFSAQSLGKDYLERQRELITPAYIYSTARHFSWPKGLDLTGIGARNAIEVKLDEMARMDINDLRCQVNKCIAEKRAVYAVVVVLGTTEQGVVEPLQEALALRDELEKCHGFSFLIHVDAAWGGYFASMLRQPKGNSCAGFQSSDRSRYQATALLSPEVIKQLDCLAEADTITIDPHKSGYVPLPAGSICYKDIRMRELIRWTAAYTVQSKQSPLGMYGIEGSKPGAASAAIWLSHKVIGLHDCGIGAILSEATWNFKRLCCQLYTSMADKEDTTFIIFLRPTPAEMKPFATPEDLHSEKRFIRDRVLKKNNREILEDEEALNFLAAIGSDLNVNCFICNFKVNGKPNKDVHKANDLNRRIAQRCSAPSNKQSSRDIPFHTSSTILTEEKDGECLRNSKKRGGLEGEGELVALRIVVMLPFYLSNEVMFTFVSALKTVRKSLGFLWRAPGTSDNAIFFKSIYAAKLSFASD